MKKAELENRKNASTMKHFSPDFHQAIDNSTPSANRSSIKLPFGTNTGFQEYYANLNVDNYEMTPSNCNRLERASHFSEVQSIGASSAALYFSEVFNPDMYEIERVVDSNDQSPMANRSQS